MSQYVSPGRLVLASQYGPYVTGGSNSSSNEAVEPGTQYAWNRTLPRLEERGIGWQAPRRFCIKYPYPLPTPPTVSTNDHIIANGFHFAQGGQGVGASPNAPLFNSLTGRVSAGPILPSGSDIFLRFATPSIDGTLTFITVVPTELFGLRNRDSTQNPSAYVRFWNGITAETVPCPIVPPADDNFLFYANYDQFSIAVADMGDVYYLYIRGPSYGPGVQMCMHYLVQHGGVYYGICNSNWVFNYPLNPFRNSEAFPWTSLPAVIASTDDPVTRGPAMFHGSFHLPTLHKMFHYKEELSAYHRVIPCQGSPFCSPVYVGDPVMFDSYVMLPMRKISHPIYKYSGFEVDDATYDFIPSPNLEWLYALSTGGTYTPVLSITLGGSDQYAISGAITKHLETNTVYACIIASDFPYGFGNSGRIRLFRITNSLHVDELPSLTWTSAVAVQLAHPPQMSSNDKEILLWTLMLWTLMPNFANTYSFDIATSTWHEYGPTLLSGDGYAFKIRKAANSV